MSSKRYPSRFESRAGFFASTRDECLSPRVRLECKGAQRPWVWGLGHGEHVSSHELVTSILHEPCVTHEAAAGCVCNVGDLGSTPRLRRCPEGGHGNQLQYSGLENSMDCIVHGAAKSRTQGSRSRGSPCALEHMAWTYGPFLDRLTAHGLLPCA